MSVSTFSLRSIDIITAIAIHLITPLLGLLIFLRLIWKIKREKIEKPPIIDLLIIFATYGGLLLLILTTFFWKWSGMASLGSIYSMILAPIAMGVIAYRNFKKRKDSKYHMWTYTAGLLYFVITPLIGLIVVVLE